jgi:monofunctional biosynthetic peptidoglycan transglycosylase
MVLLIISLVFLSPFLYFGFYFFYPDVSALKKKNPVETSFMKYREEQWRKEGKKKKITRIWTPYGSISPYLVKAVIIAEDDKFWSHEGFDFEAIQEAIEKDIRKKKFKFGGSTISQQLAKNLYLSPEKSPIRKIKEAILTWRIERNLSKKRILELYLNTVEWGDGTFGVGAASLDYFGKPAADLTPEEAARLAVVLPNPKKLNPLGTSRYVEKRSRIIYNIMVRRGIVIPEYEDMTEGPEETGKGEEQEVTVPLPSGEAQIPEPPVSPRNSPGIESQQTESPAESGN